jgi:4-hydroxy-tetrahydrodipicolinate reductase
MGKVGKGATKMLLSRKGVELVGAIDINPNLVGKDVGEVLGLKKELGVAVSDDPDKVLSTSEADVVIIATSSWMKDMYPAISQALKNKMNVVTPSTELAYIWANLPDYAKKIDDAATAAGVTVLGAGCGNYFGYPILAALTGVCEKVDEIHTTMIGDFSGFSTAPKSVGHISYALALGKDPEEYEKEVVEYMDSGGHEGKGKSGASRAPFQLNALLADTLGWKLDAITSAAGPVTSDRPKKFGDLVIEPGKVCGMWSRMTGVMDGKDVLTQHWRFLPDPEEDGHKLGFHVEIKGTPNLKVTYEWDLSQLTDGHFLNISTYRAVANAVPFAVEAPPGLDDYMHIPTVATLPLDLSKFGERLNKGVKEVFIRPGS